jgi:hypothetical protein
VANTLGNMLDRISDETRYSGSAERTIFGLCVQDAIAHYEVERFWWNEARALTFSTVANQRAYGAADNALIPYILEFDTVTFTRSSNDSYLLTKRDWQFIEFLTPDTSNTIGPAWNYAYYSQQIWLDPIPDAVYSIRVAGLFKLAALSADGDTNAWVTLGEGEELIRNRAKAIYYSQYTRDDANATRALQLEQAAYLRLKMSTQRRGGTNQIRGYL